MRLSLNEQLCEHVNTYEFGWNLVRNFLVVYDDDKVELDEQMERLHRKYTGYLNNGGYDPESGAYYREFADGALDFIKELDELGGQFPGENRSF